MSASIASPSLTLGEYVAVTARVESIFVRLNERTADTVLTYDDDERVLGEITALLRELGQLARRAGFEQYNATARHFANQLYAIEGLIAYSQIMSTAAQINQMVSVYVDYIVARDLAAVDIGETPIFTRDANARDDRLFCQYVVKAAPVLDGRSVRLYGIGLVERTIAMIDDVTRGHYVESGRGVLNTATARRIAQHIAHMHELYSDRFEISPANIAITPHTGVARVLFASWQDLTQMNSMFANDAIIERALRNTSIGPEIVSKYTAFRDALDHCQKDMREVLSSAWVVIQNTPYMDLSRMDRDYRSEVVGELRAIDDDFQHVIRSHEGRIFYHGVLRANFDKTLGVELKTAIERYSR